MGFMAAKKQVMNHFEEKMKASYIFFEGERKSKIFNV